jgi:hypothetical protein
MPTSHLPFTARIEGSPETIFELIATCRIMVAGCPVLKRSAGQRRCRRIRSVSAQPISTRDRRARSRAPSRGVTLRSTFVFHHTMLLMQGPLAANIDVHISLPSAGVVERQ